MRASQFIAQKQSGKAHAPEDIRRFIHGYAAGELPESAMAAWLMAVYFQGMTDDETFAVVESMITSGKGMDFSHLPNFVADKHSTGGVGDKVSIILGPLMAAAGLAIPMLSGRSLGHTGGTLDKLDSIPGYRTELSLHEFRHIVETVGVSMIGQTDEICPADKKMYLLRDATSTIKSVPLICGSIMSKKIAEGIQGLVLDIKVGNGAFMESLDEAKELAATLIAVGDHFGISTEAIFSNMNQPLGKEAGLWNEVEEAIHALQGNGPDDVMEVTHKLGDSLLTQANLAETGEEACAIQERLISDGKAFNKFVEMVEAHGGDASFVLDPEKYEKPIHSVDVKADQNGYILAMNTRQIGLIVNGLTIIHSGINPLRNNTGGVRFYKKVGAAVKRGEVIACCLGNDEARTRQAANQLAKWITVGRAPVQPIKLIL